MALPIHRPAKDDEIVKAAMESTADVSVFQHRRLFGKIGKSLFFGFEPLKNAKGAGVIIYPGTIVDAKAHAPLAKRIAENGHHAAIATPPFSLASVGDLFVDYANHIINFGWKDSIKSWVISGHSQGGAIACAHAKKQIDKEGSKLKGVILLAAFAGDKDFFNGKLSDSDYDVMSIYGSLDGIALYQDVVVEGAKRLPSDATFIEIEGGNHSQFSHAEGLQESKSKGKIDGIAKISLKEQQDVITKNMFEFLSKC